MGQGTHFVAASCWPLVEQGFRDAQAAAGRAQGELINLCCELRKLKLVVGSGGLLRESSSRREQQIQRSLDQAIQSLKETLEVIQAQVNPDGDTITAGYFRPLEPSGYFGSGTALRDLIDQVQGPIHGARPSEPPHEGCVQLETQEGHCGEDSRKDF